MLSSGRFVWRGNWICSARSIWTCAPTERPTHALAISRDAANYHPGDIVAWDLGRGALEVDTLFRIAIIGHYRLAGANNSLN
jgi:uncharacterized protein YijF (DUF1287 family)